MKTETMVNMMSMRHCPLLGLLVLLPACASAAPRPATVADLVGSWHWIGEVPMGARIPTLAVGRDGSVTGNSGINRFRARLDLQAPAGEFRLGPTPSTRLAGTQAAMQMEQNFLQLLNAADHAVIEGRGLTLKQGDDTVLQFARVNGR